MPKQRIASILEDVLGEYILNISRENIRIATLQGKIKLKDVQLDGDLIGSYTIGSALGLSGLGILSCHANVLQISIPWTSLEKEPTRVELSGVHLLCVPLTTVTASRTYATPTALEATGAGDVKGSAMQNECSLRTRAKRSALARFQRNFFAGRIEGEGPISEKESKDAQNEPGEDSMHPDDSFADSPRGYAKKPSFARRLKDNIRTRIFRNTEYTIRDLHIRCEVPAGALDPKFDSPEHSRSARKSSPHRCAFSFGVTLDCLIVRSATSNWEAVGACSASSAVRQESNSSISSEVGERYVPPDRILPKTPERRNRSSPTGGIGPPEQKPDSAQSQTTTYKIMEINDISIYWDDNLSYLLSESSLFNAEQRQLSSRSGNVSSSTTAAKVQQQISSAMDALKYSQDPVLAIPDITASSSSGITASPSKKLFLRSISSVSTSGAQAAPAQRCKPHRVVCHPFSLRLRATFSGGIPGFEPPSRSIELLPCNVNFILRPQQCEQYSSLRTSTLAFDRYDTMLHQRPVERVSASNPANTRAWWKYCISCVMTRPTSRPWRDVKMMIQMRPRYVELAQKQLLHSSDGLTAEERGEWQKLLSVLPIEVLLAFHLLALRSVVTISSACIELVPSCSKSPLLSGSNVNPVRPLSSSQWASPSVYKTPPPSKHLYVMKTPNKSKARSKSSLRRIKKVLLGSGQKTKGSGTNAMNAGDLDLSYMTLEDDDSSTTASVNDEGLCVQDAFSPPRAIAVRQHSNFRSPVESQQSRFSFDAQRLTATFLVVTRQLSSPIVRLEFDACCSSRNGPGEGRYLAFDLYRFEAFDCIDGSLMSSSPLPKIMTVGEAQKDVVAWSHSEGRAGHYLRSKETSAVAGHQETNRGKQPNENRITKLPKGIICRASASVDQGFLKLRVTSYPATLVYNKDCVEALSDFMKPTAESRSVFGGQLRNAATPLALKAQLALISPMAMSIKVDVDAPKLWIPVSSRRSDGALFLDAGRIKFSLTKREKLTDTNWKAEASEIQAKFVRSMVKLVQQCDLSDSCQELLGVSESYCCEEISVVCPFNVCLAANVLGEENAKTDPNLDASDLTQRVTTISFDVGSISLNLVDVDVLAKAIGRWYAAQVATSRLANADSPESSRRKKSTATVPIRKRAENIRSERAFPYSRFRVLINVTTIEMALEGYIKSTSTLHERTYLLNIVDIKAEYDNRKTLTVSQLSIGDVRAVQMAESESGDLHPSSDPRHQIFVRTNDSVPVSKRILFVKFEHDGNNHLDEVEVEVESVVVKITPTTFQDCGKGLRRIFELAEIMTREMERRIHRQRRSAKEQKMKLHRDRVHSQNAHVKGTSSFDMEDRCHSPTAASGTGARDGGPKDSGLLVRLTLKETVVLFWGQKRGSKAQAASATVIQVLFNVLCMFQSIENSDGSGSRTLHASLSDLSVAINPEFAPSSTRAPLIGPISSDFRVVYATENLGRVVSQEFTFDCEDIKCCMDAKDLKTLAAICAKLKARFISSSSLAERDENILSPSKGIAPPWRLKSVRKGSGVATVIRGELQLMRFLLLKGFCESDSRVPLVELSCSQMKGMFDGCESAMQGELTVVACLSTFNPYVAHWEYVVEPWAAVFVFEQLPNDVSLSVVAPKCINVNLASSFMRDAVEAGLNITRKPLAHEENEMNSQLSCQQNIMRVPTIDVSPTSFSTILVNECGLDAEISTISSKEDFEPTCDAQCTRIIVKNGTSTAMPLTGKNLSLAVLLKGTDTCTICTSVHFPMSGCQKCASILTLTPCSDRDTLGFPSVLNSNGNSSDRHHFEHVVEWCIQNQCLRDTVTDVYNLKTGKDLLSSHTWSPGDTFFLDVGQNSIIDDSVSGSVESSYETLSLDTSTDTSTKASPKWSAGYWESPGDVAEWTDLTCVKSKDPESIRLPNADWIWVNEWTVDLSGCVLGMSDADGWSYEVDFDNLSKTYRSYKRGDQVRRRRWTRTRIKRDSAPWRLVWDVDPRPDYRNVVTIRSTVSLCNVTDLDLVVFARGTAWQGDVLVAFLEAGSEKNLPLHLACATHIRLARHEPGIGDPQSSEDKRHMTDPVVILPTSNHASSTLQRVSLRCLDLADHHFIVRVNCNRGLTTVNIEPVLKIVNLLPCAVQVQLGEVIQGLGTVAKIDEVNVEPTGERKVTSIDPRNKPKISLRLPGYRWSTWKRVVNRNRNSESWIPDDEEEEPVFPVGNRSGDYADEFDILVRLDSHDVSERGDHVFVVVSIETGYCPTLRCYSQYWIVDKSGFGLRFCEGISGLLVTNVGETSRRSYLPEDQMNKIERRSDTKISGHEWSLGMNSMSLYFSRKEKLAVRIEAVGDEKARHTVLESGWSSAMDVSHVMPKTVFSLDQDGGYRRFELALSVSLCPSVFYRTKMITIYPRYQIVNLLERNIAVAQDGCLKAETTIPPQACTPFHWEQRSLPPRIRIGTESIFHPVNSAPRRTIWSVGCIELGKVGITSMRLPVDLSYESCSKPLTIQAEVRLATPEQNSAVVIVVWHANETSNPLYVMRNTSSRTIFCRQPLPSAQQQVREEFSGDQHFDGGSCHRDAEVQTIVSNRSIIRAFSSNSFSGSEYIWTLKANESICFGFDDPAKPHNVEWTHVDQSTMPFDFDSPIAVAEPDKIGSLSTLPFAPDGIQLSCRIQAEHSTKVMTFYDVDRGRLIDASDFVAPLSMDDDEDNEPVTFTLRIELPGIALSVIDNSPGASEIRELLRLTTDSWNIDFSHNRDGFCEMEVQLMALQVDNYCGNSIHPVMIFCPRPDESEPFIHVSAVRRIEANRSTYIFCYAAVRILEVQVFLDRVTAETIARFLYPLRKVKEKNMGDPFNWIVAFTSNNATKYGNSGWRAPRDIGKVVTTANTGRVFFEQLHLHPIRLSLTFTQEWTEWTEATEGLAIFQFIRGMPSIANAPLTFKSFVVSQAFEAPHAFARILATHYSSQLAQQIFAIFGSLAILSAPADFLANVGTGVRDFFYEPINGLVHGPAQFLEGLETGAQSLARGIFIGVTRSAANVAETLSSNLVFLTDSEYIHERSAHQRMVFEAMLHGKIEASIENSLYYAGSSLALGFRSGALGIIEQPMRYASKHGPAGFLKGIGKAVVGAVVKPMVAAGDAANLVNLTLSEAAKNKTTLQKIPKRLRRALPQIFAKNKFSFVVVPYDENAAKAQKIVTGSDTTNDVYLGHVLTPSHLIILSEQFFWAIDRKERRPFCLNWDEISHFEVLETGSVRIAVYNETGLKYFIYHVSTADARAEIFHLLASQVGKMGNCSCDDGKLEGPVLFCNDSMPGVKSKQISHMFGSCNKHRVGVVSATVSDDSEMIGQCKERLKLWSTEESTFFKWIDEEAWALVDCWHFLNYGLSSRRCASVGVINASTKGIQIKSAILLEGGSEVHLIPTRDYDPTEQVLRPGGAIIMFCFGAFPSLSQPGNVFLSIETNAFVCDISVLRARETKAHAFPGYRVGFLEKSFDSSLWWAKCWILVRDQSF